MDGGEEPMRVMVLVDSLAPGGSEISTIATLPLLAEQGIEVQMVILKTMMPDRGEIELRRSGTQVRNLQMGDGPLRAAWALRPVLRRERPDLLHTTLFSSMLGGTLAAVGTGVPVLTSIVNTPPEVGRRRRRDTEGPPWKVRTAAAVESLVYRRMATHLHAVTPGVRDSVVARYRVPSDRITVAERGRDATRFVPPSPKCRAAARRELGLDPDDEVVVSLARQEPQKGLRDLVDAIEDASRARPRLKALLAGRDGSDSPALRDQIGRSAARDRITLLGDRPDPETILAAADAFVLSSLREGASGATLEAMAMGIPVVATDVAGLRGITVDGTNARIVPAASPAALGAAMVEVLGDETLAAALAAGGRATFLDRFTLEQAAAALGRLYRQVAATGAAGVAR